MQQVAGVFKELEAKIVRWNILDTSKRIDGRDLVTVRPIVVEAGFLPRTHGSALFTRGETQAIVVATLGTGEDEQWIDALQGTYKEAFMLHYNFPPFSVGETGRIGAPAAARSATASSPGGRSARCCRRRRSSPTPSAWSRRSPSRTARRRWRRCAAPRCADGRRRAAEAADRRASRWGLILEDKRYAVLSDILGDEDHLGDMDFKVAGTEEGVTALQMDIKIAGITEEIMQVALSQAKQGRLHILGEMGQGARHGPRRARRVRAAHRDLQDRHRQDPRSDRHRRQGDPRDRREDRRQDQRRGRRHREGRLGRRRVDQGRVNWIKSIASDPEIGHIYEGTVVKTMDFGAFVNFFGAKDGLVHISQLAPNRVQKTTDVVKEGDKVKVKLLGFDERGKVRLSMKVGRPADRRGPRRQAQGRRRTTPGSPRARSPKAQSKQGKGRLRRPFSWPLSLRSGGFMESAFM
jgi:polyribonucleotide nucleotidyltransferase